jgi:hypothetical protein
MLFNLFYYATILGLLYVLLRMLMPLLGGLRYALHKHREDHPPPRPRLKFIPVAKEKPRKGRK